MSRLIPNTRAVDNDYCTGPVELAVPVVIVDNDGSCFWFHEAMDGSSAERMAFAMTHSLAVEAYRIDIRLVLPAASDVRAATSELDGVQSIPVRVKLQAD